MLLDPARLPDTFSVLTIPHKNALRDVFCGSLGTLYGPLPVDTV
jgi:hypothetical protein